MGEYLLKSADGAFVTLPADGLECLLAPDLACETGWGSLRMRHDSGAIVVVSDEMPGLQVWFEGDPLDGPIEAGIVKGMADRLSARCGQQLVVVTLD